MKVFLVFILLTALTVGVVILMDLAQAIPFYDTVGVLKLPLNLIGGQEGLLLFCYILLLIISHRRIMKNEKN